MDPSVVSPFGGGRGFRWGPGNCLSDHCEVAGGGRPAPLEGCDRVLSSAYATIFGLPLTLFGFLAYITMLVLAVSPLPGGCRSEKRTAPKLRKPHLVPNVFAFLRHGGL